MGSKKEHMKLKRKSGGAYMGKLEGREWMGRFYQSTLYASMKLSNKH